MRVTVLSTVALGVLLLGAAQTEIPDAPVKFISVDELKALVDKGTRVDIIDVRRRDAYLKQHIKGARNVPLQTMMEPEGLKGIPKRGLVVFYCTCPHAMSVGASNVVAQKGWRNQRVLNEGLPGWIEKGYPVAGTDPGMTPEH